MVKRPKKFNPISRRPEAVWAGARILDPQGKEMEGRIFFEKGERSEPAENEEESSARGILLREVVEFCAHFVSKVGELLQRIPPRT